MVTSYIVALAALSGVTLAQFPPTPEGITTLKSHVEDGVTISYKEVRRPRCMFSHVSPRQNQLLTYQK